MAENRSKTGQIPILDRDLEIFYVLQQLRLLSSDQVTLLFFGSPKTAYRRLAKLRRANYLQVMRPFERIIGTRNYWLLTAKSARLLQRNGRCGFQSPHTFEHQIGLNWIYCHLRTTYSGSPDEIVWEDGSEFTIGYRDQIIRPDAQVHIHGSAFTYWIEYDRATKSSTALRENLKKYAALPPRRTHQFCLLYCVPSEARKETVKRIWRQIIEKKMKSREVKLDTILPLEVHTNEKTSALSILDSVEFQSLPKSS